MKLSMIVAASENGCIGKDGKLPWHLPKDLAYFKQTTIGSPIIMGRKTFESLPGVLPGRPHIVVTRNTSFKHEGVIVVHSVYQALKQVENHARAFVIGGGEIYQAFADYVDFIYLTRVHQSIECDTRFDFPEGNWQRVNRMPINHDPKSGIGFYFSVYSRTKGGWRRSPGG